MQDLHALFKAINSKPPAEQRALVKELCESWKNSSRAETARIWHDQFVYAVTLASQALGAEVPCFLLDQHYLSQVVKWPLTWARAVNLAIQARAAMGSRSIDAWAGDIPRKPYLFSESSPLAQPVAALAITQSYMRFIGTYAQSLQAAGADPEKAQAFHVFYVNYCLKLGDHVVKDTEWYRAKRDEREVIRAFLAGKPGPISPSRILVTRHVGGLGDILMMNYALQELRRKFPGHTVEFAVPAQYLEWVALFEGIVGRDIHGPAVDWSTYSHWYDLGECPSVYEEVFRRPFRATRIEAWCKAMDVSYAGAVATPPVLRAAAPEAQAWAGTFLAEKSSARGRKIAIQWAAADEERCYPHMVELAVRLAQRHEVFVFHHVPPPPEQALALEKASVKIVTGTPAAPLVALLERMDLICGPDSSFTHLAGQMGKPGVGIYGPVDGHVRTVDYPSVACLDMKEKFPCQPCWRFSATPCAVSGTNDSSCLRDLPPERIERKVEEMLAAA